MLPGCDHNARHLLYSRKGGLMCTKCDAIHRIRRALIKDRAARAGRVPTLAGLEPTLAAAFAAAATNGLWAGRRSTCS